jgi:tetratricopeptide (TPR) repeat protein
MSFASESSRQVEIERALARAEELRQAKRLDEGIALLLEALPYSSDKAQKAQLYYRLGNLYYDAGKYEQAEYAYRQAITHDPLHINAHYNLGVVYRKMGRIAESIQMRKKANALARRHPERVKLSQDDVQRLRRFARNWLIGALIVFALLIWLVWLLW